MKKTFITLVFSIFPAAALAQTTQPVNPLGLPVALPTTVEPQAQTAQPPVFNSDSANPLGQTAQPPAASSVIVNGVALTQDQLNQLAARGCPAQPGSYWYDRRSGSYGYAGGPAVGYIPAGMNLGGPLQRNASNGDSGYLINGRELTRLEGMQLAQVLGVGPGRYAMDAATNFGFEGQPPRVNLRAFVAQRLRQMQQVQDQAEDVMPQPQNNPYADHRGNGYGNTNYGNADYSGTIHVGGMYGGDNVTTDGEGHVFISDGSRSYSN